MLHIARQDTSFKQRFIYELISFQFRLGISPKIREIHEIRGTEIYSHGFLEIIIFQISPKIRETKI